MKKVLLIGKNGSGKATLCKKISKLLRVSMTTETIDLEDMYENLCYEYGEKKISYSTISKLDTDAELIVLVYDPTQSENLITHNFANFFSVDVIGIITKIKKCESSINIQIGREKLEMAGVSNIFEIDTKEEIGLEKLFDYLCD